MTPYWMLPQNVCVEARTPEEAKEILLRERGQVAHEAKELPYPAGIRVGPQSQCPAFCLSPNQCAGRKSCPRNYACSE